MGTTDVSTADDARATAAPPPELRLEVVVLPVSDPDRAKRFYAALGWREDGDSGPGDGYRILQFTPPGSAASIIFGTGVTAAPPGSVDGVVLAVADVRAAAEELRGRGADVSEVFHDAGGSLVGGFHAGADGRAPGPDPQGRSYGSYASFRDPDGNGFLLQEITERLPGRVSTPDAGALAALLRETAEHHDRFEKASAAHDWWDWYAPYLHARQQGATPAEADALADRYMADVRGVVARR